MKVKKIALRGLLIALALVLSYLESLLPPLAHIAPGLKLGLPNIAVVFALYRLGGRDAAAISLLRVALVALLFGSVLSLAYSAAGAAVSLGVMLLLRRSGRFGGLGVSVAGALAHNLAQIATAALLLGTSRLIWYLPTLLIGGTVAGIGIGLVSALLVKRVKITAK